MKRYYYRDNWYTVKEIASMTGVEYVRLLQRLYNGYSIEQAVTDNPLRESVLEFFQASHWEDWVDETSDAVYTIYWQWCVKHGHNPECKNVFMKSVRQCYPQLTTVPNRGKRYIREVNIL